MWKNFLLALALLTIAMTAALYSSSAANEGRGAPAAISAIISLALALWVGFRFLPHLAKGVRWNWVPQLSRYHFTKDGWIFIVATAIVIFAAINTSNNLLYMVLSVLVAVLLLSGFLLELNFKFLETEILLPSPVSAGERFPFSIRLHNQRRVFPLISIRIEPGADSPLAFDPIYFAAVDPLSDATLPGEGILSRRGRYIIRKVQGASRFPFGLLSKKRICAVNEEILCFPALIPRDRMNLSSLDILGSIQRFERGSGSDLHTIRDYQSSDSARHVHWKASAKTASLKTREYAADESRRIVLALDRYGARADHERFEQLIAQTASLAFYGIEDDVEVALVSDEWRSATGSADVILASILEYLACVEMSEAATFPDVDPNGGSLLMSLRQGRG